MTPPASDTRNLSSRLIRTPRKIVRGHPEISINTPDMADQVDALIDQLGSLRPKLSSGEDFQNTRAEALQLTRKITAGLEPPETAALDLAYSVRTCILDFLS